MMATNNNDTRKKHKTTVAVDNGGNSSLPIPVVLVPYSTLSFGNILKEFPDFLFLVLPYIADRMIWNSVALSNKDIYEQSKAIQPPWPLCYKLPSDETYSVTAWSPCGTRLAFRSADYIYLTIIDQRHGPLRRWSPTPDNVDGYIITDLKYSPDGSYLVSAGEDGFIRLWDNVTGNYEQLQEWNIREEVAEEVSNPNFFSISACSKYITVSFEKSAYLKDVEGKTIKTFIMLHYIL